MTLSTYRGLMSILISILKWKKHFGISCEVGQSELAPNQPLRWTFHCNLGSFNVLQSGFIMCKPTSLIDIEPPNFSL
jgi:hypothetical protein